MYIFQVNVSICGIISCAEGQIFGPHKNYRLCDIPFLSYLPPQFSLTSEARKLQSIDGTSDVTGAAQSHCFNYVPRW